MSLENIILNERSQIQKATYCMTPFVVICTKYTEQANLQRQKTGQELAEAGGERMRYGDQCLMGKGFLLRQCLKLGNGDG